MKKSNEIVGMSLLNINTSVGPPTVLKATNFSEFDSKEKVKSSSKTFGTWILNPWKILTPSGIMMFSIYGIKVTFVKATDPVTNIDQVFATILFRQSTGGYQTNSNGIPISILAQNQSGGLLEEWKVASAHQVACSSLGAFITYKQQFRPDWFDQVMMVTILLNNAIYIKCP